jgi:hypothetical protein
MGGSKGVGGAGGAGHNPTISTAITPCRLLGLGNPISMDVSPDGTLVAFGSVEGGVTLLGVSDFVAQRTITAHSANVTAVAFSPDSTRIATADAAGNVALWGVADGSAVWSTTPLDGSVEGLAFSVSGTVWALTAAGLYALDGASGSHTTAASGRVRRRWRSRLTVRRSRSAARTAGSGCSPPRISARSCPSRRPIRAA